ncbi:hypothetical protein [Arcanobacterium canis]
MTIFNADCKPFSSLSEREKVEDVISALMITRNGLLDLSARRGMSRAELEDELVRYATRVVVCAGQIAVLHTGSEKEAAGLLEKVFDSMNNQEEAE